MEQSKNAPKKFINKKENVVNEALDGLCMFNPTLARINNTQIITLKKQIENKVTLLCGGGSGHEPAHCGFVDEKMLQAAICGGVFASPSYQEVQLGIEQIAQPQGVLVIIKNYTGDVMNFELASGFARTKGIQVKTLIVADDVAFIDNLNDSKGDARGLSGTVLLYKILGAAAYLDKSLDYIHDLGQKVLQNTFTLGVSMSSCSIPGFSPNFHLNDDEIEIGLGIHGEQGQGRQKVQQADEIIEQMLQKFDNFLQIGDEVFVLVNNLGSCTEIEMCIVQRSIVLGFQKRKITILGAVEGRIMTSLEMQGILITIYKVQSEIKEEVMTYLNLPVDNKYWKTIEVRQNFVVEPKNQTKKYFNELMNIQNEGQGQIIYDVFHNIFTKLQSQEEYLNGLDRKVGDGDTGISVTRACTAVMKSLNCLDFTHKLRESVIAIGQIVANSCGGSSGPLYGVFLCNAAMILKDQGNTSKDFQKALEAGTEGVANLGKVKVGERTMYDVLYCVSEKFKQQVGETPTEIIKGLIEVAQLRALEVTQLRATKGRSRYLGGKEINEKDPGCELIALWLGLIQEVIAKL